MLWKPISASVMGKKDPVSHNDLLIQNNDLVSQNKELLSQNEDLVS